MPPIGQRIGDRFVESETDQDLTHALIGILGSVDIAEWPPRAGQCTWNMAIPVDSTHLFDHVLGQRAIQAKLRRRDGQLRITPVDPEPQTCEDVLCLRRRHLHAQHPVQPLQSQHDACRPQRVGVDIGPGRCVSSGEFLEKRCGPVDRRQAERRAQAFLESKRCLGSQPKSTRGGSNSARLPGRGLEQHVCRPGGYRAGGAADDACDRLGTLRICHDHRLGAEYPGLTVKALQLLALARPPDDHATLSEPGMVEGVHWLPALKHHVIRDVDHVADRADTDGA